MLASLPRPADESVFTFLNTTVPAELCTMLGSCSFAEHLAAVPAPQLSSKLVAALSPLAHAVARTKSSVQSNTGASSACQECKVRRRKVLRGMRHCHIHVPRLCVHAPHNHTNPCPILEVIVAGIRSALAAGGSREALTKQATEMCTSMGSYAPLCM